MPGCVLRAFGEAFNVDAFLEDSFFEPSFVQLKGARAAEGRLAQFSALNVEVSHADGESFERQVADALKFLEAFEDEVRRLASFAGVEGALLDFEVHSRLDREKLQCCYLPADLIRRAGELGLGVELSMYAPPDPSTRP